MTATMPTDLDSMCMFPILSSRTEKSALSFPTAYHLRPPQAIISGAAVQ